MAMTRSSRETERRLQPRDWADPVPLGPARVKAGSSSGVDRVFRTRDNPLFRDENPQPSPCRGKEQRMPIYTLPDLKYDYGGLEPHLSAKILQLHHDKHHAAYVTGANETLEKLADARKSENFTSINQLEKSLAFHISGHKLHSILWSNMGPKGGGEPSGDIKSAIEADFGDLPRFQKQFNAASAGVQGSGWGVLCLGAPVRQAADQPGLRPPERARPGRRSASGL